MSEVADSLGYRRSSHSAVREHPPDWRNLLRNRINAPEIETCATAPAARADDFSDIVANVESSITAGQTDFTAGQADYALDTPLGAALGVSWDAAGTNDFLIAPVGMSSPARPQRPRV